MHQNSSTSQTLISISPIDGRYHSQVAALENICSEMALMRLRVSIEIKWLQKLITDTPLGNASNKDVTAATSNVSKATGNKHKSIPANEKKVTVTSADRQFLDNIINNFSLEDASRIKEIEAKTNHDVKAIEYFIKEKIATNKTLNQYRELIHFGCTSDDSSNLAYALMLKEARDTYLLPKLANIIEYLRSFAHANAAVAMLARTHGQPATPTTIGKEFANFAARLKLQYQNLAALPIFGKFNGAVGNYNALVLACPDINWRTICHDFVTSLGLEFNPYTTQIEPHDYIVSFSNILAHINSICLAFCRDIWGYVALNYFSLQTKPDEIGSSTMPHKVNPIDFENAEGNLGLANAILNHFAAKLPISRWQRDLSDSTVTRNLGSGIAYCLIAYNSILTGVQKLKVNSTTIAADLDQNWEVLAEAIQTTLRYHGIPESYEKLKALTHGKKITPKTLHAFIHSLELPQDAKRKLLALTPQTYIGKAAELAREI